MPAGGLITLAGLGLGLAGGVGKGIQRSKSNRELRNLMGKMPGYQVDESVKNRLGLAQTLLNARMPGAAAAERNIYQTEANQMANAQRAASSGNELLLAGAGAAGQANQAFGQLGQAEAADYQRRYGNLAEAQSAMTAEKQREFENKMQRYQMEAQLQGAIQENKAATWGDISNFGMGVASMGASGGLKGLSGIFGKGTPSVQATGSGFSPSQTNIPGTVLPSNMLSQGYGSTNPYSNIPNNWLSSTYGQTSPYEWWKTR